MSALHAGEPLEPPSRPVGRRSFALADPGRDGRRLEVEVWYPAAPSAAPRTSYEVFPGVAYTGPWAQHEPPAAGGPFPLVLFSHGRTGTRLAYSMVCEALAARGAVVVSAEHPGDALADWLTGRQTDDRTNEVNRVADAHLVLDALLHGHPDLPDGVEGAVGHGRVALAGHSYGAYTAFATVAGARGVAPHPAVRAAVGFQPYMRSMSDGLLGRVHVPSLLVVAEQDTVTPAHVDADRAWQLLPGTPAWRLDLAGAGHQAISDIALYAELAAHVPGLPDLVRAYLEVTAAGASGPGVRPWREVMADQVAAAWAFLHVAWGVEEAAHLATAESLAVRPGLTLARR